MTLGSTLGNMTTGDSDDKSLLCVFEHSWQYVYFLCVHMFKEYLHLLKVRIVIRKYSYIFVII